MKLAYVLPRYGEGVVGGAEHAIRLFAQRLVTDPEWSVEVFTTTAVDHLTYENALPPGESVLDGVVVRRFPTSPSLLDTPEGARLSRLVFRRPEAADPAAAEAWLAAQGPVSEELVDAVEASDADLVVVKPYLLWTTVHAARRLGRRAVMHPAAHDEPILGLPVYDSAFAAVGGFVYNTHEERDLVERRFGVGATPALVLGLGVDSPADGALAAMPRPAFPDLGDRPYLAAIGRVEIGKGSLLLARYFAQYKASHPGPLALVLMGPCADPDLYRHPDVVVAGVVDEETKWAALRHAVAVVAPSPYESFSMAVTEGWAAGAPVLVNGRCAVTRGHAARSGGGLWFDDYRTFEAAVATLEDDAALREALAARGRAYVDDRYRWPPLVARYRRFLAERMTKVPT